MMILYRILSFIVNFFCALLAFQLLVSIGAFIRNPMFYLQLFIIISVILYAWFAYKFSRSIIIKKEPISKRTKDWLQVNAIVTFVFSTMMIIVALFLIFTPTFIVEFIDSIPEKTFEGIAKENIPTLINKAIKVMALFGFALFAHVIWTIILLRKNKEFIVNE